MNVGREIAAGDFRFDEDRARARYRKAREIVGTIPSGTLDADLSPEQAAALVEYEAAIKELADLRETS